MSPSLLAITALALGWVLSPFYGAILWAFIVAMLFMPVYRHLLPRLGHHRNLTAAVVMLLVVVVGVIPFAFLTAVLAGEASYIYQRIESGGWRPMLYLRGIFDALPPWMAALLARAGVGDFDKLQAQMTTQLSQGTRFIATQSFSIGSNTFGFVASMGVTLYLAFFLVRDGIQLSQIVEKALPIPPQYKRALLDRFMEVVRATLKGSLLIAAIQGSLGGMAFWLLGVHGVVLWAVVMAFASLIPVVGASIVWLPVAVYFLLTGAAWKGLVLMAYGVLAIGLVDNLLRPMLVGKGARMPDYVVMITTLGGLAVFGLNGVVIGPTIAAIFIAVWQLETAD
jgi:predicted PurR-regulated permease PerM